MSANVQPSAHSWASAHRLLLTLVAIALALAVALTIAFVVSRTTADETSAPGGSVNLSERLGPADPPPGYFNDEHLGMRPR